MRAAESPQRFLQRFDAEFELHALGPVFQQPPQILDRGLQFFELTVAQTIAPVMIDLLRHLQPLAGVGAHFAIR